MFANATQSALIPTTWPRLTTQDVTRFVGIDIGVDRVNVASLGREQRRGKRGAQANDSLAWISRTEFALPGDLFRKPTPDLVEAICDVLQECLPRCVDGQQYVATVALPLPWIHYETTAAADLTNSQANCDSMFAASIFRSPAQLSHWSVCDGKDQQVVAATAEHAACQIAKAIASVGYSVQSILPHGVALIHAAKSLTSVNPHSVVLLESFGGLVATHNNHRCGLCRTLPACEQPDASRDYIDQLEPWLKEVASEVSATSRYLARLEGRSNSNDPVLICGSMAQINGVAEALATMLGRGVAVWRYSSRTRPNCGCEIDSDDSRFDPGRAVAISLAHCSGSRYSAGEQ